MVTPCHFLLKVDLLSTCFFATFAICRVAEKSGSGIASSIALVASKILYDMLARSGSHRACMEPVRALSEKGFYPALLRACPEDHPNKVDIDQLVLSRLVVRSQSSQSPQSIRKDLID